MTDEKKTQGDKISDIDEYYGVICGYVEFCIQDAKTNSAEDKECSSTRNVEKKEEIKPKIQNLKNQKKNFQNCFDSMCASIAAGGNSYLSTYIDAAKRLYEEKTDWKRDVKAMLVSQKSLKLFRSARGNLVELYPLLIKVNETFPVDDYSELSIAPNAALYGSEVNKTQMGSDKKPPLKNEDIQDILDMFLQVKDSKRFGEWVWAILCFEPSRIVDRFQTEFAPKREKLKEWLYEQVEANENYKHAVMDTLLKENKFKEFLGAYIAHPVLLSKQAELEERILALESEIAKEKAEHKDCQNKQQTCIQEREEAIRSLQKRSRDYEFCKRECDDYRDRYQTQIDMNERIVVENKRRLSEMEIDYGRMQDELSEAQSRLEAVETKYSALQSDFSLKNNELTRLKDMVTQKEKTAKVEIMKELISGIDENLYYLTMFHLDLKDTGKLNSENIGLYADTLENIDNVLMNLGIKKIGVIDQKVSYDSSIHTSTGAKIANGEQVKVCGYGWKIGDEVYIKAPVEKGE